MGTAERAIFLHTPVEICQREGLKRKKERKKEKKITEVVTHGQANFLLSYVESV